MIRPILACALMVTILNGLVAALPGPLLMDFGSFIASGQAAGQGLDPYGIYPLTFRVDLPGFEAWNPNLNPPPSLPLFQALAGLAPDFGFRLWWGISLLSYCATVWLLARRYGGGAVLVLWAFALAGLWDTLVLGQIYLVLVLGAVAAWLLLDAGRHAAAGLLIGLIVAVKPNFAVWPALLVLAGHTRPGAVAAFSAAMTAMVPLLLYGPGVYGHWLDLVLRDGNRAIFLTNASLSGIAQRLDAPLAGSVLSLGLLAALAVWARRSRPPPLQASALALAAAVLASPIAWVHYTLFLLPVFFALQSRPLWFAAGLLVVPVPMVLSLLDAPAWQQASVGSVYGWAMILVLIALLLPGRGIASEGDTPHKEEVR